MYIYWIVVTLVIIAGNILSQSNHNYEVLSEQATIDSTSRSILVYRRAAAEYAWANPGFVGAPPESALNLPTWYRKQIGIASYIEAGVSFTYIAGTAPAGLVAALAERTDSATVGVNHLGQLYSPKGGTLPINVPSPVPEGSVVAVY